jgi:hypothetical protein
MAGGEQGLDGVQQAPPEAFHAGGRGDRTISQDQLGVRGEEAIEQRFGAGGGKSEVWGDRRLASGQMQVCGDVTQESGAERGGLVGGKGWHHAGFAAPRHGRLGHHRDGAMRHHARAPEGMRVAFPVAGTAHESDRPGQRPKPDIATRSPHRRGATAPIMVPPPITTTFGPGEARVTCCAASFSRRCVRARDGKEAVLFCKKDPKNLYTLRR